MWPWHSDTLLSTTVNFPRRVAFHTHSFGELVCSRLRKWYPRHSLSFLHVTARRPFEFSDTHPSSRLLELIAYRLRLRRLHLRKLYLLLVFLLSLSFTLSFTHTHALFVAIFFICFGIMKCSLKFFLFLFDRTVDFCPDYNMIVLSESLSSRALVVQYLKCPLGCVMLLL